MHTKSKPEPIHQPPPATPTAAERSVAKADAGVISRTAAQPGRRLDSWLHAHYSHLPKNLIQKLIRKGYVLVNGVKAQANHRLGDNDSLQLPKIFGDQAAEPGALRRKGGSAPSRLDGNLCRQMVNILRTAVIFEDSDYLCLNKPAGLPVHAGSGVRMDLKSLLPLAWPELESLELAHRLDKDTSGCLVLAKHWQALRVFHQLLRDRQVSKEYTAVLHLCVDYARQTAPGAAVAAVADERPLVCTDQTISLKLTQGNDKTVEAVSRIRVVRQLDNAVLAQIEILTGRHHQIRRHAASVRQPVVGDRRYGLPRRVEEALGLSTARLLLHAKQISFTAGRLYRMSCPLPPDMSQWLKRH